MSILFSLIRICLTLFAIAALYFICVINLNVGLSYFYFPLSFGLVIGLMNYKTTRFKPINSILYNILVSLGSFCLVLSLFYILNALDGIIINKERAAEIIIFCISPAVVLVSYCIYYKIKISWYSTCLIFFACILIYTNYTNYEFLDEGLIKKLLKEVYLIWQLVVAFILQLLVYKDDLKEILFKSNVDE